MSLPDVKSRYDKLVREVCPKVLRKVIEAQARLEHTTVDTFVDTKINVNRGWYAEQKKLLSERPMDLEGWDITLLAAVIEKTFDNSLIKANVKEVKDARNKLMHGAGNTSSDAKVKENWVNTRKIIGDLAKVADCQREINDDIREIQYGNVRDGLAKVKSTWPADDRKFAETKASGKVEELLKDRDVVTIVGESGSGKSGIAHHVAIQLEKEGYTIYPVSEADHIALLEDEDGKQIFVFDDPVGTIELKGHTLAKFNASHDVIMSIIEKGKRRDNNKKIIVTCRKEVFEHYRVKEDTTLIGEGRVDLSADEFILTESEKENMINAHIERRKISNQHRNEIKKIECPNFPLLCQLFAINRNQKRPLDFFSNDVSNSLKKLFNTERKRKVSHEDIALLLCVVFENSFDITWLHKNCEKIEYEGQRIKTTGILKDCKMSKKDDRNEIERALQSSSCFRREENRFRFLHDVVFDAAACYISKCCPNEILKHCTSTFIQERVRTESVFTSATHEIVIEKSNYEDLVERFYSELNDGRFHEVFLNPSFKDETFVNQFVDQTTIMERSEVKKVYTDVCPLKREKPDPMIRWSKHWFERFLLSQTNTRAIHWLMICPSEHTHMLFDACWPALFSEYNPQFAVNLLPIACLSGNKALLNKVLQQCGSLDLPEGCEELGFSLLHLAAVSGEVEAVKILVDNRFDINGRTKSGQTPLYILAALGHAQSARSEGHTPTDRSALCLLLNNDADINACDIHGKSPLHTAAENGHSDSVSALLKHTADSSLCDKRGTSPLYVASQNGHTSVVSTLVDHEGDANINVRDSCGKSPLYAAAENGLSDMVSCLLNHKADVNLCDSGDKSPLHAAAENGHIDTVSVLLQKNADSGLRDKTGATPVYAASQNGHKSVVATLLDHSMNAEVNLPDNDGKSPLLAATVNGHDDTVSVLLLRKADSRLRDKTGTSPMYIASQNGNALVVSMLLDKGADVNACNNNNTSPLYTAVENGHIDIVRLLLQHNADSNLRDRKGVSPLHVAARDGHTAVVSILLQYKADVFLRNSAGKLPGAVAADYGRTAINRIIWKHMINQSISK